MKLQSGVGLCKQHAMLPGSTSPDGSGVEVLLEECLQLCLRVILIQTDHLWAHECEKDHMPHTIHSVSDVCQVLKVF